MKYDYDCWFQLPYDLLPSTTVATEWPFRVLFATFVRSADRERCWLRAFDGDADRTDERDDDRGNELRPSFTLNFTLNIFHLVSGANKKVKGGQRRGWRAVGRVANHQIINSFSDVIEFAGRDDEYAAAAAATPATAV